MESDNKKNESCLEVRVAILQEKIKGLEAAKNLQAIEYSRRLDELNHAHARAEAKNADYITRELFERHMSTYESWRRTIDNRLSLDSGNKAGIAATIGFIISVVAILISLYK